MNKAQFYKDGMYRDYTPGSAKTAGTLIAFDDGMIGLVNQDISASGSDTVRIRGIVKIEQKAEIISAGLPVGFDNNGDSVGGTAGEGAATALLTAADMVIGHAVYDTVAADTHVYVMLNEFLPSLPYWPNRPYETKSANYTIDLQDAGKVIQVDTDAFALTLTAVAAMVGVDVIVQNIAADGVALVSISPHSDDKVDGQDISGTNNKDLLNTKTTAIQGDWVRILSGTDWCIAEKRGIWATEG